MSISSDFLYVQMSRVAHKKVEHRCFTWIEQSRGFGYD